MLAHSNLKMRQVAEYYGYKINRAGYINCPLHREKTPSLKIYDKSFYCFGCSSGGTVIDFVIKVFGIDFKTALAKINEDFMLGTTHKLSRYERMKIAISEDLKRKKQQELTELESRYWKVFYEWKRLDDNKRKFRPKTFDEPYHNLFVEALQKLCYQEYLLDIAEVRLKRYGYK